MLVQCRKCGVSFDANMERCLACGGEHMPSGEERRALAVRQAYRALKAGTHAAEVRLRLASEFGGGDAEADEILVAAQSKLRDESRQHGRHLAASGLALVGIAAVVYAITGGFFLATGCFAMGALMTGAGSVKASTGWNITGHDDDD